MPTAVVCGLNGDRTFSSLLHGSFICVNLRICDLVGDCRESERKPGLDGRFQNEETQCLPSPRSQALAQGVLCISHRTLGH